MGFAIMDCQHDLRSGFVTIASDNKNFANAITELNSAEPKKIAILKAASVGLPDPRINGLAVPYAVRPDGEPVGGPGEPIDHYRIDIPVTSGR